MAAELMFNNNGVPLLGFGNTYFASTTGVPEEKPKSLVETKDKLDDKLTVGKYIIPPWNSSNDFPNTAGGVIDKVGVLNTGLKYIRNFTLGQGIFPVNVEGFDDNGNEVLKVVDDPKVRKFCQGRMARKYMEKTSRDYLKFGIGFPQLIANADGSQLVGIETINARHCRLTEAKDGVIEKCIVSGQWPDTPTDNQFDAIDVLDDYDPLADLQRRKWGKQIAGKSFIYAVRDSWSNEEYYSRPAWWSAYLAGWTDVASVVPNFLRKAYENQITWKWHVQIPYAFWDKKFPKEEYADITARQNAIQEYMDALEKNLTGSENANKPIFTFFEINPSNGKAEEQWIIKPLENKLNSEKDLVSSAAANSEILFSLMINPNVMGAGMPGGTYAGNQGGSNIREAFLVNIANAWLDRQNFLDPLEAYLEFNGVTDVELRFRNTILTTLDTGSGTKKTLS